MKISKFIKAPNSSTIILNPEWVRLNYPKTWDLMYEEIRQQIDLEDYELNKDTFKCPNNSMICNQEYACDACPYNKDLKNEKTD